VTFAAQWLAHTFPCRRFTLVLADNGARLGADADRYSFVVSDLHQLLLDGIPGPHKGAIANMLARAEVPLLAAAEPIADAVRASPVVGSDETSARVGGKTPAFAGAGMVAMGAAWLNCDLPCDRRHARGIGGDIVHRGCASRGLGG
jgi:hypothetical protein